MHTTSDDALARRNALILAAATALAGANSTVIFATAAILGATLAPDPSLATLPISVFVVGMATATLPTGLAARRFGRRAAFLGGSLFGFAAGLVAYSAVMTTSFWLLCLATFLGGVYGAVAQSFRFAAADTASARLRPKVISWVLAGGIAAAVLGPQLVQLTMDLHPPFLFSVTYLAQAGFAVVSMATLAFVRIPVPPRGPQASGRPLRVIARQPLFVTAVICGVASYGLMNLVMTSAPLAMKMCGHPISASNLAIQWHVLAMYAPSFFTGSLIARFGASRIVALGLVLLAATGVVDLAGITVGHFWTGMILLGLGWNFGFVGASAMVAEACAPEERNKVQAFNDFLVFGTMAVGSFFSGHLLASSGWAAVNVIVFPPVLVGLAALAWYRFRPQHAIV